MVNVGLVGLGLILLVVTVLALPNMNEAVSTDAGSNFENSTDFFKSTMNVLQNFIPVLPFLEFFLVLVGLKI